MSGRKGKHFVGYNLTRTQTKIIVSLVENTCGRLGVHKKFFRTEASFWEAISQITGLRRSEGEEFFDAILRVRKAFMSRPVADRVEMINGVDRRGFYTAIGMKLHETATYSGPMACWARKTRAKVPSAPTVASKEEFYKSWEWRTLRMEVLKEQGRSCQCCGSEPGMTTAAGDPVSICVDHIKPLSKFWNLRLDKKNLQVLCDECNQGKGNWDQTDFRAPAGPDEWIVEDSGVDQAILDQLSAHGETIQ
jgi:5-methylcytosine-specific restriction endonuclease McrA